MSAERSAASREEQAVIDAARAFVATTSVFRQPKASRDEFATLAYALLDLQRIETFDAVFVPDCDTEGS